MVQRPHGAASSSLSVWASHTALTIAGWRDLQLIWIDTFWPINHPKWACLHKPAVLLCLHKPLSVVQVCLGHNLLQDLGSWNQTCGCWDVAEHCSLCDQNMVIPMEKSILSLELDQLVCFFLWGRHGGSLRVHRGGLGTIFTLIVHNHQRWRLHTCTPMCTHSHTIILH